MENKSGCVYASVGSEHCIVQLLDLYLAKLPPDAHFFYMRPLENALLDDAMCGSKQTQLFSLQCVGVNKLNCILPDLSAVALSIQLHPGNGNYSKVFLGVPEKLIAEKNGHCNFKAWRFYKRTEPVMERAVSI